MRNGLAGHIAYLKRLSINTSFRQRYETVPHLKPPRPPAEIPRLWRERGSGVRGGLQDVDLGLPPAETRAVPWMLAREPPPQSASPPQRRG
jgi:hypothetical protein